MDKITKTAVALTINNNCNQECPHCYLNYQSPTNAISNETLEHILRPGFLDGVKRVVLVGKETLFNKKSRDLIKTLLDRLTIDGVELEIITNGLNLRELDPEVAKRLASIDISLDGGPNTYDAYRGAATKGIKTKVYDRIREGVRILGSDCKINILHTLSSSATDIEDMMQVMDMHPQKIIFSPFIKAADVTDTSLTELPIVEMMRLLAASPSFMTSDRAFLVLGTHSSQGLSREELRRLTEVNGLKGKVRWIGDSSEYVRITHDGVVTGSQNALAPSTYGRAGVSVRSLESVQDFATPKGGSQ